MIAFSMQIVPPDDMRAVLLRTLGSLLGPTRATPGCLDAHLYVDLDRRKSLMLVEEWQSREQFTFNLAAEKLNTIVAAIDMCSEPPIVRIDDVQRQEGMEKLADHASNQQKAQS